MSTGSSSRCLRTAALTAATLLGLAYGSSQAQSLKLRSLSIPQDIRLGRWVSFQVKIQSRNRPSRELVQRLAIVANEGSGEESGVWVELKTVEAGKARIERGFFGQVADVEAEPSGDRPLAKPTARPTSRLLRYQVLTPDGKLYEYPVGSEGAARSDEDISAMDVFDFLPARKQDWDSLGPDTLGIGRKVVPCRVDRIRRYGGEEWSDDDTSFVDHAVMTQSFWRNPAIPVTGYARSILEVSTERVRVAAPPAAPADSAARAGAGGAAAGGAQTAPAAEAPADSAARAEVPEKGRLIYRAELTLLDLGDGAVPEVTQEPELAPEESAPSGSEGVAK